MSGSPLAVGVFNDVELVVRGVAAMLEPYTPHRLVVVERDAGGQPSVPMDVALFDTFASRATSLDRAGKMVRDEEARHVLLYTWDAAPDYIDRALAVGLSGFVLKSATSDELVGAIERAAAGEIIGFDEPPMRARPRPRVELSDRESEVLALIARGATNAEIAEELYLSVETVKTYVKRLYAKLGVNKRAQAAVLATEHGLAPRR